MSSGKGMRKSVHLGFLLWVLKGCPAASPLRTESQNPEQTTLLVDIAGKSYFWKAVLSATPRAKNQEPRPRTNHSITGRQVAKLFLKPTGSDLINFLQNRISDSFNSRRYFFHLKFRTREIDFWDHAKNELKIHQSLGSEFHSDFSHLKFRPERLVF